MAPGQIVTVQLAGELRATAERTGEVTLLTPRPWRVGANKGMPDPEILAELEEKIAVYERKVGKIEEQMAGIEGAKRLRLQHLIYVLQREQAEAKLSLLLNRRKLNQQGALTAEYLFEPDAEIAEVGLLLNRLRIKRRIFDYVVQVL
jgi:hypothetical protein